MRNPTRFSTARAVLRASLGLMVAAPWLGACMEVAPEPPEVTASDDLTQVAVAEPTTTPGLARGVTGLQNPTAAPPAAAVGSVPVASVDDPTPGPAARADRGEGTVFGTERFVFHDLGTGEVECDVTWELSGIGPASGCDDCVWASRVHARYLGDEGDGSCADRRTDMEWSYGLRIDPFRGPVLCFDEGDGWQDWMEVDWDGRHVRYDGRRSSEPSVIDGITYELEFGYQGDLMVEVLQ